jgi:hypothetical protein
MRDVVGGEKITVKRFMEPANNQPRKYQGHLPMLNTFYSIHMEHKTLFSLSIPWSGGGLMTVPACFICVLLLCTIFTTPVAHVVQVPQHAQQHPQQVNGIIIAAMHCTKHTVPNLSCPCLDCVCLRWNAVEKAHQL